MLVLNRRFYLQVILIVVLGLPIGCSSNIVAGDPANGGLPNSDSEDEGGPNTGEEGPASDGGGGSEPGTSEPSDPGIENPSDDQPPEPPEPGTNEPSDPGIEDPSDDQPPEPPEPSDDALPDFSVADVNEDSPRYGEAVSPRDYLGRISAWYFGHAT